MITLTYILCETIVSKYHEYNSDFSDFLSFCTILRVYYKNYNTLQNNNKKLTTNYDNIKGEVCAQ